MTIDNTAFAAASQCQCSDCPGASCRCGCQHVEAAAPAAAAGPSCACGPTCACGPQCACNAAQ